MKHISRQCCADLSLRSAEGCQRSEAAMDNQVTIPTNTTNVEHFVAHDSGAYLLAVVEVDKADRILCQAEGCGHAVYKRIHVALAGLEFKVLGSQCYERLYGQAKPTGQVPQYGTTSGTLLTPEERLVLVENTAAFIEALEAKRVEMERCAALEATQQRDAELARATNSAALSEEEPERPKHVARDACSPSYEGGEMLRWRWRAQEAITAKIAEYEDCPSQGPFHARVMAFFKNKTWPTPYSFALDLELKQCLPKPYIFQALDELSLIERAQT